MNTQGRKSRIRVLLICSMSLFMVGVDITAVNVALPSIGEEMGCRLRDAPMGGVRHQPVYLEKTENVSGQPADEVRLGVGSGVDGRRHSLTGAVGGR